MRKVKNKAAVRNLAKKNYRDSIKRNRTAITAIALTTILFTIIFTLGIGMMQSMQYNSMRISGGSAHGSLKYLSDEQYEAIKDHPKIKKIGKNVVAGIVANESLMKRPVELNYSTKDAIEMNFVELLKGHMPDKADEIVLDTITLDILSVPYETGAKVKLTLDLGDRTDEKEFTLCGYYEGDPAFLSSLGYVSQEFVKENLSGRGQDYWKSLDSVGSIRADIMFSNSSNIEKHIKEVITDSGYIPQEGAERDEKAIAYGVNWAYISANLDQDVGSNLVIMLSAALLILLTGYLIIYNVFQISVIRDIRFYGLLKTIGTTGRQIRTILIRQAMRMCCWGIPIGLVLGFAAGKVLLPIVMRNLMGGKAYVTVHPAIFAGSAVFSLATVLISCMKPAKIAARVSPVEAVKFSGVTGRRMAHKKGKNTSNGAKPWRMAFSNLGRNRKRTAIAVVSMSLSLILMNSVFILAGSFDMDKFVAKFINVDFQCAHASYFNNNSGMEGTNTSEQMVRALEAQPGFAAGGGIYKPSTIDGIKGTLRTVYQGKIKSMWGERDNTITENQGLETAAYGMDEFCFESLKLLRGNLDLEKLRSGEGVLLGTLLDK